MDPIPNVVSNPRRSTSAYLSDPTPFSNILKGVQPREMFVVVLYLSTIG